MGVRRALAALGLAVACAGVTVLATPAGTPTVAAAARPNVVVIYVDDVGPDTTSLWSKAERTPELARFARYGVEFSHAITSTPLCGPSRATLLTGQYGHNHRITANKVAKLDTRGTLPSKLKQVGYDTILVGKYVNGLDTAAPRRGGVWRYARGWNHFDVIWKRDEKGHGQAYGYRLWTREGTVYKGYEPLDHSTYIVGKRVAKHIRNAPKNKPVYAVASVGAGHKPNIPLAWHRGSDACTGVARYASPAFDEADVSDKPRYIRRLPRLKSSAFSLRSRCEEMLGVDEMVATIRQALQASGRLNDTLFIFTADNGYLHGDHRAPLPGVKKWPHSVGVPLYMLWPARLGGERRVVREPVSNVDLPVTICALAGCRLPDADGRDISRLLTGETQQLSRGFVYTEMLRAYAKMPAWHGLVTTSAYSPDAIWHYTEYSNGRRELYNLTRDPYRLRNLAGKSRHAQRVVQLHRKLHRNVIKPDKVRLP